MPDFALKIRPFTVPEHVVLEMPVGRRQDGAQPLPQILLKEIPQETLIQLIRDFEYEVLIKAGYTPEKQDA
jgi:hypothetical protein